MVRLRSVYGIVVVCVFRVLIIHYLDVRLCIHNKMGSVKAVSLLCVVGRDSS